MFGFVPQDLAPNFCINFCRLPSPLHGWDAVRLKAVHAEFLIQVAATAETYMQVVRARTSYVAEEVICNARFSNILEWTESGSASVDICRISEVERVA